MTRSPESTWPTWRRYQKLATDSLAEHHAARRGKGLSDGDPLSPAMVTASTMIDAAVAVEQAQS